MFEGLYDSNIMVLCVAAFILFARSAWHLDRATLGQSRKRRSDIGTPLSRTADRD